MTSLASPPEGTKVILHWLNKSRSQRILFLLEELHVPYEIRTYQRTAERLAPPELKNVHALGKSPVIEVQVPGREPVILAESALIIEYLCEYWGKQLIPSRFKDGRSAEIGQETEAWLRYKYYMNYAEGSLMPFLVMKLVIGSIENAPVPFFLKPITRGIANRVYDSFLNPNLTSHFAFLESELASAPNGGEYICGELSAADFLMIFPLEAAPSRVPNLTKETHPKVFAYVERLQERESYKRAVEVIVKETGEYDPAL